MLFVVLVAMLAFVCPTLSASLGENTTFPLTYRSKAVEGSEQVCGPDDHRRQLQALTRNDLSSLIRNNLQALVPCNDRNLGQLEHCPATSCCAILEQSPVLRPSGYYWITSSEGNALRLYCDMPNATPRGTTQHNPADSCSAISLTSCSSGYYWVRNSNGTAVQVYCDVNRVCGCTNATGWTRVANLNTRDPSQQCPGEWTLQTYSSVQRRLCGGVNSGPGCLSATYSTYGISYNQVCGRVIGYAYRSPDAFHSAIDNPSIEANYVDGLSITHGPPGARQHIWTFAGGLVEDIGDASNGLVCPCANRASRTRVPSFVGSDYFCESGNPGRTWEFILYASDPLWDGQGCGSPPCCELSYPPGVTAPWFCKQLPQTTTDDIEIRICGNQPPRDEDTPVEVIELFIR